MTHIAPLFIAANLLFCCISFGAAPPQSTSSDGFFALNALGFFHYRNQPDAQATANKRLEAFRAAGARFDRFDFWWGEIEPTKGKFKWDKADWIIDYYSRNKIGMLPILCYKAEWMQGPPKSEKDFTEFADYVARVVGRYKGRVKYWEIWNEPNIPTFWKPPNSQHYAQLLKVAYAAAKKADPNCVIVGAAANETDVNFLLDLAKFGAANSMDVVSFHPYSMADGPDEMHLARQIRNVRTVMLKSGRPTIPVWITEMGWIADISKPEEIEKQCRYMVQSHAIALAEGVEKLFWFNLQDWREGEKLEGWGLLTSEGKPKPTLGVYRRMADQLERAEFIGYIPTFRGKALLFERDGDPVIVAWGDRGYTAELEIPTSAKIVTYRGEAAPASAEAIRARRRYAILGLDPVYIYELGKVWKPLQLVNHLPDPMNLLVNSNFELQDNKHIYGWSRGVFYGGETDGTFEESSEDASPRVGNKHSAALSKTKSALWQSYPIPALPGETYTLTAKIKTADATGENGVQILFLSGPGWGWKGGPTSTTITGTSDWQTVTVTGTVPDDADVVRVNLVSKDNSGTVYFDDLKLSRGLQKSN